MPDIDLGLLDFVQQPTSTPAGSSAVTLPEPTVPPSSVKLDPDLLSTITQAGTEARGAAAAANRRRKQALADLESAVARTGTLPVPTPVPFQPPSSGIRDYLHQWSRGRLTLAPIKDRALDSRAAKALMTWRAANPNQASIVDSHPQGSEALASHFRALTAINHDPASPLERMDTLRDLYADWRKSAEAGKIVGVGETQQIPGGYGAPGGTRSLFPESFAPQAVTPKVAADILAKLNGTLATYPARALDLSNLSAEEREVFQQMGGERLARFIGTHSQAYTARSRLERLIGRPVADPQAVYTIDVVSPPKNPLAAPSMQIPADRLPDAPPNDLVGLGALTTISPFALAVARGGTQLAGEQAQYKVDWTQTADRKLLGAPLAAVGEKISNPQAAILEGIRTAIVEWPMQLLDAASSGGATAAFAGIAETPELVGQGVRQLTAIAASPFGLDVDTSKAGVSLRRQWRALMSSWGRSAAIASGSHRADDAAILADLHEAFPAADPATLNEVAFQLFNAHTAIADTAQGIGKAVENVPGVNWFVNNLLGFRNPAVREELGLFTEEFVGLTDPGEFALNMAGLTAASKILRMTPAEAAKYARSRLYRIKEVLTQSELKAIRQQPNFVNLAHHTVLTQDIARRLGEIPDRNVASSFLRRLEEKFRSTEGAMHPDVYGSAMSAIERAKRSLAEVPPHTYLPDAAKEALRDLTKPTSTLSFFDQEWVLSGNAQQAASAAMRSAGANWLRAQRTTPQPLDMPPGIPKFQKLQERVLKIAEDEAALASRKERLTTITDDLARQLELEDAGNTLQRTRIDQLRESVSGEWNSLILEEADRFDRLETGGGEIKRPKPITRSPVFKKIHRTRRANDPALLRDLAQDQQVISTIQTPEWRDHWDALRAELDRSRGKEPVPDATVQAHRQHLDEVTKERYRLEGEALLLYVEEKSLRGITEKHLKRIENKYKPKLEELAAEHTAYLDDIEKRLAKKDIEPAQAEKLRRDVGERINKERQSIHNKIRQEKRAARTGEATLAEGDIPDEVGDRYGKVVVELEEARRSLRSLRQEVKGDVPKSRNTEIGFWESRVKRLEREVKDLREQITGRQPGKTPESVKDFLALKTVRARQRSIDSALARATEQAKIATEALASAERAAAGPVRPEAEILSDMDTHFTSRVDDWLRETTEPETLQVQAAADPRLHITEGIRDRAGTLQPGDALPLTPDELAALNEYRASKINTRYPHTADVLRKASEGLAKDATDLAQLRKELGEFRDAVAAATPDNPRIKISKSLRERILNKLSLLDDAAAQRALKAAEDVADVRDVFRQGPAWLDNRHVSLEAGLEGASLPARQAFEQALEGFSDEHRLLREGAIRVSSYEAGILSQTRAGRAQLAQLMREARWRAAGFQNSVRYKAAMWRKHLGRELTPAQRQQVLRDIREGKPRSEASVIIMQKQRRQALDHMLRIGMIDADFYHSLLRQGYYHGVFDRSVREQIGAAQAKIPAIGHLPDRLRPLASDPYDFQFKIPEDSYYVVWQGKKGRLKHKAGFRTPQEASRWADGNLTDLPDGTEASIHAPWSFDDKLMKDLIGDIGYSHMTLMEKLGHNIAAFEFSKSLEHSGLVRSAADFGDELIKNPDANMIVDANGKGEWYKIQGAPGLRHLYGKWMHRDGLRFLDEVFTGYRFFSDVTKSIEATRALGGAPLDLMSAALEGVGKVGKRAFATIGNILALDKIALAARAYVQGWTTNLAHSYLAGVPLTPEAMAFRLEALRDYFRHRHHGTTDPLLDALYESGSILPDTFKNVVTTKGGWESILANELDKSWKSIEGLRGRLDYTERRILEASAAGDHALEKGLHAERLRLREQLSDKVSGAHRAFFTKTLQTVQDTLRDGLRSISGEADAKFSQRLWHAYQEGSLDNGIKYATMRYLEEKKGFDRAASLDHVRAFHQHLHRVPDALKKMTNFFGGAKFVSFAVEQYRILRNTARFYPKQLAKLFGVVGAFNLASLIGEGTDPETFFESYALTRGLARDGLTDTMALFQGIHFPAISDQHYGDYFLSFGPSSFDTWMPQSDFGRKFARVLGSETQPGRESAPVSVPAQVTAGLASKFFGSEPAIQLYASLVKLEDEKGDPIRGPGDFVGHAYRNLAPDWFPGARDATTAHRWLKGENIDPSTHRLVPLREYVARRLFEVVRVNGTDRAANAAIRLVMEASGRAAQYKAQTKFDDLDAVLIARKAVRPDGTVDPARAEEVIRDKKERDPEFRSRMIGLSGDPQTDKVVTDRMIAEAVERASRPTIINRFHRLAVDDAVAAYAIWMQATGGRDTNLATEFESIIYGKLERYSSASENNLQNVSKWVDTYANIDKLPQRAVDNIFSWEARARYLPFKSLIER